MNLKNYTSNVPVSTTISYIEAYLAGCGVTGISKEFKNGVPVALYFHTTEDGRPFTVRLPAQVEAIHDYFWNEYLSAHRQPRKQKEDFVEQAARCAWKIQQDWVQVQMSLVKLKQAKILQVFLAFVWDTQRQVSYYENMAANKFKSLPETAT